MPIRASSRTARPAAGARRPPRSSAAPRGPRARHRPPGPAGSRRTPARHRPYTWRGGPRAPRSPARSSSDRRRYRPQILGIEQRGERGRADQVAEQHRQLPALDLAARDLRLARRLARLVLAPEARAAMRRRTRPPGGLSRPQAGQRCASAAPQRVQKRPVSVVAAAPQTGQSMPARQAPASSPRRSSSPRQDGRSPGDGRVVICAPAPSRCTAARPARLALPPGEAAAGERLGRIDAGGCGAAASATGSSVQASRTRRRPPRADARPRAAAAAPPRPPGRA